MMTLDEIIQQVAEELNYGQLTPPTRAFVGRVVEEARKEFQHEEQTNDNHLTVDTVKPAGL